MGKGALEGSPGRWEVEVEGGSNLIKYEVLGSKQATKPLETKPNLGKVSFNYYSPTSSVCVACC